VGGDGAQTAAEAGTHKLELGELRGGREGQDGEHDVLLKRARTAHRVQVNSWP